MNVICIVHMLCMHLCVGQFFIVRLILGCDLYSSKYGTCSIFKGCVFKRCSLCVQCMCAVGNGVLNFLIFLRIDVRNWINRNNTVHTPLLYVCMCVSWWCLQCGSVSAEQ